jgi:hypothetical protein
MLTVSLPEACGAMRTILAVMVLLLPDAALAAARAPLPPPVQSVPQACKPADSADYSPGVDVHGMPVAPADLPSGNDIVVDTTVFVDVGSPQSPQVPQAGPRRGPPQPPQQNPGLPHAGVAVQLNGLNPLPPCPPRPQK